MCYWTVQSTPLLIHYSFSVYWRESNVFKSVHTNLHCDILSVVCPSSLLSLVANAITKGKILKFPSLLPPRRCHHRPSIPLQINFPNSNVFRLSSPSFLYKFFVASTLRWDHNFPHPLREPLQRLLSEVLPPWMFGEGKQWGERRGGHQTRRGGGPDRLLHRPLFILDRVVRWAARGWAAVGRRRQRWMRRR